MYSMPLHIGDFQTHTAHLSLIHKGAYVALLMYMYATEKDLPGKEGCLRIAGAFSDEERSATLEVLEEFFEETETGFTNHRVYEEMDRVYEKSNKGRNAANARWGNRASEKDSTQDATALPGTCETDANAMQTHMQTHMRNGCETDASSSFSSSLTLTSSLTSSERETRVPRDCPPWVGDHATSESFEKRISGRFGRWAFECKTKARVPVFEPGNIREGPLSEQARWLAQTMPDTADAWGDLNAKLTRLSETASSRLETTWQDPAVTLRTCLKELRESFGRKSRTSTGKPTMTREQLKAAGGGS